MSLRTRERASRPGETRADRNRRDRGGRWAGATAASRSRRPSRSRSCARPAWSSARPSNCCAAPCGPASPPASSTRIAEDNIRSSGAVPSFKGYSHPPFPASICASVNDEVVHGIPGPRVLSRRRRHLHRLRRDRRRLARRRRDHGRRRRGRRRRRRADAGHRGVAVARHRRRPARRPGHRHLPRGRVPTSAPRPARRAAPTASSRSTSATASARRCTSRPTSPTSAGRAVGPSWCAAWRWPSSRWSTLGSKQTELLDDEWTVGTADGSWAAHFEHTFTLTPDGAWVLTALDGGRAAAPGARRPVRGPLRACARMRPPGGEYSLMSRSRHHDRPYPGWSGAVGRALRRKRPPT